MTPNATLDAGLWEPLIADCVGGAWPARARATAVTLVAAPQDKAPGLGIGALRRGFSGHFNVGNRRRERHNRYNDRGSRPTLSGIALELVDGGSDGRVPERA